MTQYLKNGGGGDKGDCGVPSTLAWGNEPSDGIDCGATSSCFAHGKGPSLLSIDGLDEWKDDTMLQKQV